MKKSVISFVLITIVAVIGIGGTVYFYNKSLNTSSKDNIVYNDDVDNFTFLKKVKLDDKNSYEIIVNGKKLTFKRDGEYIYFNDKKVECQSGEFYITNKLVFICSFTGQFNYVYQVFDLDGTEVKQKYYGEYELSGELKLEEGKLGVTTACNIKYNCFDLGTTIDNLELAGPGNILDEKTCKKLKDYPDVLNKYGDIVVSSNNYNFSYSNYELSLEFGNVVDKVRDVYSNTCVTEK